MATATDILPKPASKLGAWTPWATVALVAVLAGLMLPQLMPGETVLDKDRPKVEAKSKSASEYIAPSLPDLPSPQAMLARLFIGTVFVLGLSVVSLWGVRRWMQTNAPANSTPREMRLIETLQLGNRCSVHLVCLGKREILIGVDGAGIKTLVPLASAFEDVLAEESGVRSQESGVSGQESGSFPPDS
jgi:flagellar biogenesis protein FliO